MSRTSRGCRRGGGVDTIATYSLSQNTSLVVARGSVVAFSPSSSSSSQRSASDDTASPSPSSSSKTATAAAAAACIVNAANRACLGGGGVDRAVSAAGGENLAKDRRALPLIKNSLSGQRSTSSPKATNKNDNYSAPVVTDDDNEEGNSNGDDDGGDGGDGKEKEEEERDENGGIDDDDNGIFGYGVRCLTGDAVMTGPNDYGSLEVNYVIHAVGPNYYDYPTQEKGHELLRSAYRSSLELAAKHGLEEIAFALLSTGVFRGEVPLETILRESVESIRAWAKQREKKKKDDRTTTATATTGAATAARTTTTTEKPASTIEGAKTDADDDINNTTTAGKEEQEEGDEKQTQTDDDDDCNDNKDKTTTTKTRNDDDDEEVETETNNGNGGCGNDQEQQQQQQNENNDNNNDNNDNKNVEKATTVTGSNDDCSVKRVVLCAFTLHECNTLKDVCDSIFQSNGNEEDRSAPITTRINSF